LPSNASFKPYKTPDTEHKYSTGLLFACLLQIATSLHVFVPLCTIKETFEACFIHLNLWNMV